MDLYVEFKRSRINTDDTEQSGSLEVAVFSEKMEKSTKWFCKPLK